MSKLNLVNSVFVSYFLLPGENNNYILQLGLQHSFASKDMLDGQLTEKEKSAFDFMTRLLAELGLITSINYSVMGHDLHVQIGQDLKKTHSNTYDISLGIYAKINVKGTEIVKLAKELDNLGLQRREHPYFSMKTISVGNTEKSSLNSPFSLK